MTENLAASSPASRRSATYEYMLYCVVFTWNYLRYVPSRAPSGASPPLAMCLPLSRTAVREWAEEVAIGRGCQKQPASAGDVVLDVRLQNAAES